MTEQHFMLMIRGNFYVKAHREKNLILQETEEGLTRQEVASVAPADFNSGVQIVISRASFRSLIDSFLD
jgi:hypothetical protein